MYAYDKILNIVIFLNWYSFNILFTFYLFIVYLKLSLPVSHRFLRAIKYLVSPSLSSHRRQKANVPKLLLITFRRALDLCILEKKENKTANNIDLQSDIVVM